MVLRNQTMKQRTTSNSKLLWITSFGLMCLAVPTVLLFVNPILIFINYQFRVANGSMVHDLLLQEIEGAKLYVYLFNVTNSKRFLAGEDDKLKLDEVGPFVYQEYRRHDDLEINREPGVMRYTPNYRTEFIAEESYGRPEDTHLVLPNFILLLVIQMLSKYPRFVGQLFKMYVSSRDMRALTLVRVSDYLWGNADPLLQAANSIVPGLVYFKDMGLLNRLYDPEARYRLTMGTSDAEKFQVKEVQKFSVNKTIESHTVYENTLSFENAYEGMVFPPQITPETPINLYRYSICKTVNLQFTGVRRTEYGSDAFTYTFQSSSLDRTLCDSKGWCPSGILDLSPCFFGLPIAISKGHFLDNDPKIFEKIEGLKPNRSLHDNTFVIDPTVGVMVAAAMSTQLSLALGDMSLLPGTKRFTDMFVPLLHAYVKQPKLREEATSRLHFMYAYGPFTVLTAQCAGAATGLALLLCAAKRWRASRTGRGVPFEKTVITNKTSAAPLLD